MNIMATQITGKKFPQFHHTEKGTLLLWDLAYRDNLVLLHVKTVDINLANLFETSCIFYHKSFGKVHLLNYTYIMYHPVKNYILLCLISACLKFGFFNTNTVRIFNNL